MKSLILTLALIVGVTAAGLALAQRSAFAGDPGGNDLIQVAPCPTAVDNC